MALIQAYKQLVVKVSSMRIWLELLDIHYNFLSSIAFKIDTKIVLASYQPLILVIWLSALEISS